jgi:hypothetical protein
LCAYISCIKENKEVLASVFKRCGLVVLKKDGRRMKDEFD